jgi:hypothetical protein
VEGPLGRADALGLVSEGVYQMNGFIRKIALGMCFGTTATFVAGCVPYRELVDPCWPERYNYQARHSVRDTFNAQAANGHMLDQTIWNEHFETGTAVLTYAGKEHLKYLARRQPAPDPLVFVQYSWDGKEKAEALNNDRRAAVADYLAQVAAARKLPLTFDVQTRDFSVPGLPAPAAPNLYRLPASVRDQRQADAERAKAGATQVENVTNVNR